MGSSFRNPVIAFFVAWGLFFANYSYSQIPPPDFTCINNDSLIWSPSTVSCGPHMGYNIFVSNNIDGPYSLLDYLADPFADFYIHNQPGVFYYYIETVADCPGEPSIPSDTLTNDFLPGTEILRATIDNSGQVRIDWSPVIHPNQEEYVIYKNTPSGTIPIGRTSDTFFFDPAPDISQVQRYTITVADRCDNQSIFSDFHNTIVLNYSSDFCISELRFDYTPYLAWDSDGYIVDLISQDHLGSGSDRIVFSGNQGDSIVVDTLPAQNDYCFFLRLTNRRTGFTSESNFLCFYYDYFVLEYLDAYNISYDFNNNLSFSWLWNSSARLNSAFLVDNTNFNQDLLPINPLLTDQTVSVNATTLSNPLFIEAEDVCNNTLRSKALFTGRLTPRFNDDNQVEIDFDAPILPDGATQVVTSLCTVSASGTEAFIEEIVDFSQTYIYPPISNAIDSICFVLKTDYQFDHPFLNALNHTSRSAFVCVSKKPRLFFPNAFAPNGVNTLFRPQSTNFDLDRYLLQVYNRYGEMVFESENPIEGWDGTQDNRILPAGLYLYTVEFEKSGNPPSSQQGTVFLLK